MSEKTKKVQLSKPMTWGGTNFAPGLNEMPAAAADYAVRKNFGKTGESSVDESSAPVSEDFKPLSFEETMKRFQTADFSDEVIASLKYYQPVIAEAQKSGKPPQEVFDAQNAESEKDIGVNLEKGGNGNETKEKTEENKTEEIKDLPEDFPMRHVFTKLGFKSVAEVQSKSREDLIALNGIAETTADKALAYGK